MTVVDSGAVSAFRHFLLALLLCGSQLLAAAHQVEHLLEPQAGPAQHTCLVCLSAHDLGTALPSVPLLVLPAPAVILTAASGSCPAPCLPLPAPVQRGPPLA
ncbi:MAG: hypothetical protein WBI41_06935 [Azovibrio sp.]|uniref:hypothetical protein n=1 Tax=Azovibrio sp. TaxID=1872673 RepID=UPI003C79520B